jgi:galactose mutarotase-like enzyme
VLSDCRGREMPTKMTRSRRCVVIVSHRFVNPIRRDMTAILLATPHLAVRILPQEGGRVESLRSPISGLEFLTQSQRQGRYPEPSQDRLFQDGPCAGIEECLPTVGPCRTREDEDKIPDHGDFWQLPWTTLEYTDTSLSLQARGFSKPLLFSKTFNVEGCALRINYQIENPTDTDIPCLYACHPLFAVSRGDRIVLPPEVDQVSMFYSRSNRLGPSGQKIGWPNPHIEINLDVADSANTGFAEMLYTDRLGVGRCGIYRTAEKQGLLMSFSAEVLPYVGIWLCYGGWPEGAANPKQYAVALEPTFAPVNTLTTAEALGLAKILRPGKTIKWEIAFAITDTDTSLSDFTDQLL